MIADMRFSTHVLWSLLSLDRKTIKTGNRSNDTLYYEKIGLRPITGTFEYSLFHERRFTCWKQNRGFKSLSTSESSFLTLKTVKKNVSYNCCRCGDISDQLQTPECLSFTSSESDLIFLHEISNFND